MGVRSMVFSPRVKKPTRKAAMILATNRETAEMARRIGAQRVEFLPDTALLPEVVPQGPPSRSPSKRPRILWVGKDFPWKGLPLAIASVRELQHDMDVELLVAGAEPVAGATNVTWLGTLPFNEMPDLYRSADVFLFTSLRESMGSQIIEAAAQGLPIVALDLHGVSTFVPDDASIKVPLSGPEETIRALSRGLGIVLSDEKRRVAMSKAAWRFGQSHTLAARAAYINAVYASVSIRSPS